MSATYFWKDGEVLVVQEQLFGNTKTCAEFDGLPCLDAWRSNDPEMRYGMFIRNRGWKHIPVDHLPKEFRTHLLLLGVS